MPLRPDRFPILQARPAHDLMNQVTNAQKQLAAISLTQQQKRSLDSWVDIEFTCATVSLEGTAAPREEVVRMAESAAGACATADDPSQILLVLEASRALRSLIESRGSAASLTPSLLIKLHSGSGEEQRPHRGTSPEPAVTRQLAQLDSACHWFAAESFVELHPAEQASIVLLRLVELNSFEEGNTRTALAASSLFTLRSDLPPIIVKPEMQAAYRAALREGIRMNTKPMVDLVAHALVETLGEMLALVRSE